MSTAIIWRSISGNNALHLLTSNRDYKLRIELEDFEGNQRYAEYAQFSVGSYSDRYKLNVSGYTGDAGMYVSMCVRGCAAV